MLIQIANLKLFEDYIVTDPRNLHDRKCQRLFRIPTEGFDGVRVSLLGPNL